MGTKIDTKRTLRAIRRLSGAIPARDADERLQLIADIATGKTPPTSVRRQTSPTLAKRIHEGQASRSPRTAFDIVAKKKADRAGKAKGKREEKAGRDRMETGGDTRSGEGGSDAL